MKKYKEKIEHQAIVNPSYDKSLSPDKRLADYLGKYHIILNGVKSHEPFMLIYEGKPNDRCDTDSKQEIIKFVQNLMLDFASEIVGEDEDIEMKDLNFKDHDMLLNQVHRQGRNELRKEQRQRIEEMRIKV